MDPEKMTLGDIRAKLSEAGDPWEAGVTSLSSLTPEERNRRLGVRPPEGEKTIEEIAQQWKTNVDAQKAKTVGSVGAPSAYDLRNLSDRNYVTDIRDQRIVVHVSPSGL